MNGLGGSSIWVRAIGVCGSDLNTWPGTRAVLRGESALPTGATPIPLCSKLPAAERRRASKIVNLAMGAGSEAVASAGLDAATLPSIFATSSGDGENCHAICSALASPDSSDHQISPTRFHNSVHNAAAGYWAIATGAMAPSTTLNAYDGSFSAALIEAKAALSTGIEDVLVTVFDAPYPEPLHSKRPIASSLGVALALSATAGPGRLARLRIDLTDHAPDRMALGSLEALRCSCPSARGLPLLERIARGTHGLVRLDYLEDVRLEIDIDPV
jgi:Beta-ketoacyl synthase, N-terminal domain